MTNKIREEYFQPKWHLLLVWKVKPLDKGKKKSFRASKCSIFDCNWKVYSEPKIEDAWLVQHSPIWKDVHWEKQFSPFQCSVFFFKEWVALKSQWQIAYMCLSYFFYDANTVHA